MSAWCRIEFGTDPQPLVAQGKAPKHGPTGRNALAFFNQAATPGAKHALSTAARQQHGSTTARQHELHQSCIAPTYHAVAACQASQS